jgi:site-specific DNA recombinase
VTGTFPVTDRVTPSPWCRSATRRPRRWRPRVADLGDPALKERIASLKAIRNQAQAESARAAAMLETSGQQAITPQMVQRFARTARERIRIDGGGYRREHLRALAQRVEVADGEVRIIGSKTTLLQTLAAASGAKSATPGVRSSVLKWRMGCPP